MLTAPLLFAGLSPVGDERCFYCGGACGAEYATAKYVKDSFTELPLVARPGSRFVCGGCVACLNEAATITLLDGEVRHGQKTRCYSWVVRDGQRFAATKAHGALLRGTCLHPPTPPFVVCLSDSGQKHLLYRAIVSHSAEQAVITLEAEPVHYSPLALASRLMLCAKLIAATGKPALTEGVSRRFAAAAIERYTDGAELIDEWERVREEPLTRLAAWLSPNKEDCGVDYPATKIGLRSVPPQAGRTLFA